MGPSKPLPKYPPAPELIDLNKTRGVWSRQKGTPCGRNRRLKQEVIAVIMEICILK